MDRKQVLMVIIPLVAFLFLWAAKSCPIDYLQSHSFGEFGALWSRQFQDNWAVFRNYLPFIALCWVLFRLGRALAGRTLTIFALTAVVLLATATLVGGKLALWSVVAVGLFSSIGWSNTFSLAIEGIGPHKSQASSLLVMAILGGAVLPPLQGLAADRFGLQGSFLIPLLAYGYVAFYGAVGHRIGRKNLGS
jgi:MFS transporter, FHS family, L-fucose permease